MVNAFPVLDSLFFVRRSRFAHVIFLFYGTKRRHNQARKTTNEKHMLVYRSDSGGPWIDSAEISPGPYVTNPTKTQWVVKKNSHFPFARKCQEVQTLRQPLVFVRHSATSSLSQRLGILYAALFHELSLPLIHVMTGTHSTDPGCAFQTSPFFSAISPHHLPPRPWRNNEIPTRPRAIRLLCRFFGMQHRFCNPNSHKAPHGGCRNRLPNPAGRTGEPLGFLR